MTRTDLQRTRVVALCAAVALGANWLTPLEAHAALGDTIAAPQTGASGVQRLSAAGIFRVQSSVDAGGTTINEYSTSNGRIFAYSWQGPTMPDLTQLLGAYAQRYRDGATRQLNALGNLHASRVEQPDVIVESGGQMRSYVGRAWLPAALPPGFSLDDLR
jgi:hypothetical protein